MNTISISTIYGDFCINLFTKEAPLTCSYFSSLIKTNQLTDAKIFRIVSSENSEHKPEHPIQVIQLGSISAMETAESQPDKVAHESTLDTGLRHKKWSVSAARFELGDLYKSLFICMRDEPELDVHGKRSNDGEGFAVFGEINDGFDVLEHIYSLAEEKEMMKKPLEILSINLEK